MNAERRRWWAERLTMTATGQGIEQVEALLPELEEEAREEEREACAVLMEGNPRPGEPGWSGGDFFCRMVDHAQGLCDCSERAAAIRAREKGDQRP